MPIRMTAPESAPDKTTEREPDAPGVLAPVPEPAKRKKRTKAEMTEAAEIPADGTVFKMKDGATGSVVERPWPEAANLFLAKRADFADTADRYRALKLEKLRKESPFAAAGQPGAVAQQRAEDSALEIQVLTQNWVEGQKYLDEHGGENPDFETALEEMRRQIVELGGQDPASDEAYAQRYMEGKECRIGDDGNGYVKVGESGDTVSITDILGGHSGVVSRAEWESWGSSQPSTVSANIPPEAQIGDEVRIGSDTFRVGHGGALTTGPIEVGGKPVSARRRWQRELGTGGAGPWEATTLSTSGGIASGIFGTHVPTTPAQAPADQTPFENVAQPLKIERESTGTIEQIGLDVWKVGSGLLEKIGLPDYSSLQIGPMTASRQAVVTNDDRYTITRENGTKISAPAEVIEALLECGHAVEIAARILRSEAMSFIATAKPGAVVPQ